MSKMYYFFTPGAHILVEGVDVHASSYASVLKGFPENRNCFKCLGDLRLELCLVGSTVGL